MYHCFNQPIYNNPLKKINMKNADYNWWTDPKNKEEVDKVSWWAHDENKIFASIPISVIQGESGHWTATTNSDTDLLLGDTISGCASAETKGEAIKQMFLLIKMGAEYNDECRLNYQRFVPFRKGNWKHIGGRWIAIFGIHIYFRYSKKSKGGFFIPFTKLNISISSDWKVYRKWKTKNINPSIN